HERPLVVAEHLDAVGGEALGQILEHLVRSDRLVSILWTGSMHEHDSGGSIQGYRDGKRSSEDEGRGADRDVHRLELGSIDVRGWGNALRGGSGLEKESADRLRARVDGDGRF